MRCKLRAKPAQRNDCDRRLRWEGDHGGSPVRDDEAFDLERDIAERFTAAGYDKRHIAFLSTGIGAANTTYGCINSHYYDVTKPVEARRDFSG